MCCAKFMTQSDSLDVKVTVLDFVTPVYHVTLKLNANIDLSILVNCSLESLSHAEMESLWSTLDLIILTDSCYNCISGLPLYKFSCKDNGILLKRYSTICNFNSSDLRLPYVLCTDAVLKLSKIALYNKKIYSLIGDGSIASDVNYSYDQIDFICGLTQRLRFYEYVTLEKKLHEDVFSCFSLVAVPSGSSLGGSSWLIMDPDQSITYLYLSRQLSDSTNWYTDPFSTYQINDVLPQVMVTALPELDLEKTDSESPSTSGILKTVAERCLCALIKKGCVQIPVDIGTDVFEVFSMLKWLRETYSKLEAFPVSFICPTGATFLKSSATLLEWSALTAKKKMTDYRNNPLTDEFAFVKYIASYEDFTQNNKALSPQIFVTTPGHVNELGFSSTFFHEIIAKNPNSLVLYLSPLTEHESRYFFSETPVNYFKVTSHDETDSTDSDSDSAQPLKQTAEDVIMADTLDQTSETEISAVDSESTSSSKFKLPEELPHSLHDEIYFRRKKSASFGSFARQQAFVDNELYKTTTSSTELCNFQSDSQKDVEVILPTESPFDQTDSQITVPPKFVGFQHLKEIYKPVIKKRYACASNVLCKFFYFPLLSNYLVKWNADAVANWAHSYVFQLKPKRIIIIPLNGTIQDDLFHDYLNTISRSFENWNPSFNTCSPEATISLPCRQKQVMLSTALQLLFYQTENLPGSCNFDKSTRIISIPLTLKSFAESALCDLPDNYYFDYDTTDCLESAADEEETTHLCVEAPQKALKRFVFPLLHKDFIYLQHVSLRSLASSIKQDFPAFTVQISGNQLIIEKTSSVTLEYDHLSQIIILESALNLNYFKLRNIIKSKLKSLGYKFFS